MDQMIIGRFIEKLRKEKNLTQRELADKLNVTDRAISNWENGRRLPDISLMKELCNIFNISIDELIYGKKNKEENLEESVIELYVAKRKLKVAEFLTELLILSGIIVTFSVTMFLAKTTIERVITGVVGSFIWIFGIYLSTVIKSIINNN